MPGFELVGAEELQKIQKLFEKGRGNLYRYGPSAYTVREFERLFAQRMGVKYAHAVSSGTAAIHSALAAIGVGVEDEVITPAFTFVAPIEAVLALSAKPVPVEIDETYHLDPDGVKHAITSKTKSVLSIPMWASPKMDELIAVCNEADVPLIEDSAQCLGGSYHGRPLGTFGKIGTFSFDHGKSITVGEGGMVITNDEELYKRAAAFSDHGHMHLSKVPRGRDERLFPGLNYRMSEISAAVGLAQLEKLDQILARQRENKAKIKTAIAQIQGIEFRKFVDESGETGDTLIFRLPTAEQAKIMADLLAKKGFGSKILPEAFDWHYAGSWDHIFNKKSGHKNTALSTYWPKTYELLSRSIALPIFIDMTKDHIHRLTEAIKESASIVLNKQA